MPLALLAALVAGCGREELPPIETQRVALALLDDPGLLEVVREPKGKQGVQAGIIKPRGSGEGVHGELAALEMPSGSETRLAVPRAPRDAELRFATAIRHQHYRGRGGFVRFELEWNGKRVFDERLPCSEDVPIEERRWSPHALPLDGPGELRLRTSYEGPEEGRVVRAAFGRLEVVVPVEIPRRRSAPEHPNVILIVVDTLRADRLHVYGDEDAVSPNVDALAARGTLFERAYVAAPWTAPSTASIFTALTPAEHGLGFAASNFLAHGLQTIAEVLQEEGLSTVAFSCNPLISTSRNFDQGFESFREYRWAQTKAILPDVLQWIEDNRERQFYAYLHLVDPHGPYWPDEPFVEDYAAGMQEEDALEIVRVVDEFWKGAGFEESYLEEFAQLHGRLYDGEVASLDLQIGRLLARLDELGIGERTIVALTSDHGEEFREHGLIGHVNQLHDELIRIPLIVAGPGVPSGARVEEPVENRFLAPTLVRLAGFEPRGNLRGPDLLDAELRAQRRAEPIFSTTKHGRVPDAARELGWSPARPLHGVRLDPWMLFWAPGQPRAEEGESLALFDLRNDPAALRDVAAENPEIVEKLRVEIERWLERGQSVRPDVRMSGEADAELMRALGYIGD